MRRDKIKLGVVWIKYKNLIKSLKLFDYLTSIRLHKMCFLALIQ